MKLIKNILPILLLFAVGSISPRSVGASAKKSVVQAKKTPTRKTTLPPVTQQQPIAQAPSYVQALNIIKTQMPSNRVINNNSFTQEFIDFVKSFNLSDIETKALLQAGANIHATWTDNNETNKQILSSVRNNIQSIIPSQQTTQIQPSIQQQPRIPAPPVVQPQPRTQQPTQTTPTSPIVQPLSKPTSPITQPTQPKPTTLVPPAVQPKPRTQQPTQALPTSPILPPSTKPAAPITQPKPIAPVVEPAPTKQVQTTPTSPIVPPSTKPAAPIAQPKPIASVVEPAPTKQEAVQTKPASPIVPPLSKPTEPIKQVAPITIKDKIHRDLLGKVEKLKDYDIYVGAGTSPAGEPIFFAMEKLDSKNIQVWEKYAKALLDHKQVITSLRVLNRTCSDQKFLEIQKTTPLTRLLRLEDPYTTELLKRMCPNQKKFSALFDKEDGIGGGVSGFESMLHRQSDKGDTIYVAYASSEPITGPFKPKKEIQLNSFTLEDFETAYSDLILCVCVDMMQKLKLPVSTEHRGIFKNPFNEIHGTYKAIAMKLHGWAATVEMQLFNKKYMTLFPTTHAGKLLHQSMAKDKGMYLGTDKKPFQYSLYYQDPKERELIKEKFPPIKQELIGDAPTESRDAVLEDLHVFELNTLSKYYTGK